MAELILSPIIDMLVQTCFEKLEDYVKRRKGMKEELERLRDNHSKIQAVVSTAREADIIDQDEPLNKWIWQLRDAIDEAEDLLDEFLYMEHEKGLAKNKEKTKIRSTSKILKESKFYKVAKDFFKTGSNLKRLEEVVQKLDKIFTEVRPFLYLLEDAKQTQQMQEHELLKARTEGSFPKSTLIGRGEDKEKVLQWLLRKPDDETDITTNNLYKNISLLSIVGHGGMGKTSLLQHIYHQDEITKDFELKIWVCVSNNFDVQRVIADMLESSLDNINSLQKRLKSKVMSKKFLLVLDDIWEEEWDINKWEIVLAPLAYGKLGSKILTTTRMDCVASMISKVIQKETEKLSLEGIREGECLQLLNTHAFAGVKNRDDYKKLEFIARELVKKLFGSPLAAKVIGGVLNKKLDERHWTNVLKNNAFGRNEILPILKLSYTFLPKELRNCFTFCSIFPQDHQFEKGDLVRMWIAVGFIQPSDIQGEEDLEDVGLRYFDLLVQKSFFDKFDTKNYYKMHDLLHDMARFVSAQECFRFVGDDQKLFARVRKTIRHMSIQTCNVEVLRNLEKFKNLRTLWIIFPEYIQHFDDVLTAIFKETRSIRLLCIFNYIPKKLMAETIGHLMHLRYLRLNFFPLTLFPTPLCNLYHLQFIIDDLYDLPFAHSFPDDFFSREMSNLSNLRHTSIDPLTLFPIPLCNLYHLQFIIDDLYDLPFAHSFPGDFFSREMSNLSNLRHTSIDPLSFPGIGKLKFLQGPIKFCVKNDSGYRIGELEHMNDLRILDIHGLEIVKNEEEACNAKVFDKQRLTKLSLHWAEECERKNIATPELDEMVLDNLRPHRDLKVLKIFDYMGVRSAKWMNENDLNNLEEIELLGCFEWQNLPPFGQLPFLKSLSLFRMRKADWFDGRVEDGCLFPCLTELTLENCPNLQELSYLPPMLKKLEITNIGWKTLNCRNISKSIALEILKVCHCSNITYIFLAGEIESVEIEDCPNLIYFGGHEEVETIGNIPASVESWDRLLSSLSTISSLKKLSLKSIPLLKSLTDLPPSLCELQLKKLDNLDFLPSCLPTLSSLAILYINEVPKLRELPDLPPSLHQLLLINLDNLDCLPSCLPTLSSLRELYIREVPKLRELPNLPPSLICKNFRLRG